MCCPINNPAGPSLCLVIDGCPSLGSSKQLTVYQCRFKGLLEVPAMTINIPLANFRLIIP
jgi:hypothetical protein